MAKAEGKVKLFGVKGFPDKPANAPGQNVLFIRRMTNIVSTLTNDQ